MKQVFITGAAGGLGTYLVKEYLAAGYRVFGCDMAEKCPYESDNLFTYRKVDVRDQKQIEDYADYIKEQYGETMDIVINCAGILPANSANVLEDFDIDGALNVFNVNSLGPLRVNKVFLPFLKNGEEKIIINISSEAGSITTHADYIIRYDYCMSKCALNIQNVILQRYTKDDGIKIFLFNPGWMQTQMGGEGAIVPPAESARCIKNLVDEKKEHFNGIEFLDYDGTIRPW